MPPAEKQTVLDGHNDTLLRLWLAEDHGGRGFMEGRGDLHIDAPKAREGGFAGGFFAVFVPSPNRSGVKRVVGDILGTDPLGQQAAAEASDAMIAILGALDEAHPDTIAHCRNGRDVREAMASGRIAAILHFEGAEAIRPGLDNLEGYHAKGLRSIGPVWSRSNAFGHGVPLAFPGSPDQGGGLTEAGIELVRACDRLGIMLDVSHLNEAGFDDLARTTTRPIVATHSNAHALCPSPRNLTDRQLAAIAESGGLVGVNFAAGFLREDGRKDPDTPVELVIRHMDRLLEALGEDGVALGSDFDGAVVPSAIGDCGKTQTLVAAMEKKGYGRALIGKICRNNWLRQIGLQIG